MEYRCALADASGLPGSVADLAVAVQAAYWLDLAAYYVEVKRVACAGSVVALATYGTPSGDEAIDPVIRRFYSDVLGRCWPPERRLVEDGYRSLPFPFEEIRAAKLEIREQWTLEQMVGYVQTWSAVRALGKAKGSGPIEAFRRELDRVWGGGGSVRAISWPLSLRVGRI